MCRFCQKKVKHPLYCYLISDGAVNASTYIGLSRQPFFRLKSHNRERGFRCGAKSTKASAGKWKLLMVVGPWFANGGKAFKQSWRRNSRKLKSRLKMGLSKAIKDQKLAYLSVAHLTSTRSRLSAGCS